MAKSDKKSPLKARPLRNPGQSLDVQLEDLLERKILLPVLTTSLLIAVASIEWLRWYWGTPPQPLIYSVAAVGLLIYTVVEVWRIRKQVRALKLGRDG